MDLCGLLVVMSVLTAADVDSGNDWVLRHGRAVGLSICLREATERVLASAHKQKVYQAVVQFSANDRVSNNHIMD